MDRARPCGGRGYRFKSCQAHQSKTPNCYLFFHLWPVMDLSTSVKKISGIGSVYQQKLKKLGIKTIEDLLFHFPHRYEDFSNLVPISKLEPSKIFSVQGKIIEIKNTRTWKKKMILTQAVVKDKTGAIKVIWFNQPYLIRALKKGSRVCLAGKVKRNKQGIYLSNPAYEKLPKSKTSQNQLTHAGRLVPVYPETEGLSSRWLRYIIKPQLDKFKTKIEDPIPESTRKKHNLLPAKKALSQIHFPDSKKLAQKAKKRFSFEDLFLIEIMILKKRMELNKYKGIPIPLDSDLLEEFVDSLPFKLTNAQKKCSRQILRDLKKNRPMNRLLEGDVGSGKTVVATMGALNTIKAGYQVGFMAPTEILAQQHFKAISKMLKDFGVNIGLLTGKEDKFISRKLPTQTIEASRRKLLQKVKKGKIDLLIGTHALIQSKVKFNNLALVILDEQHRFGVEQRAKLVSPNKKSKTIPIPHLLSMTATPIPRTLALTIYGDLDLSLLDELPKGRKKVITKVVNPKNRNKAYNFIRKQINKGRQVFVICPRIEPSSQEEDQPLHWSEAKAVKQEYQKLSQKVFPNLKVGMLHGKMSSKEKRKQMTDFKNKKTDILVSTSVVEVGVDIPNASVMMIEGAERFGLAQLHQFRGRVGRAKHQSFCFLFTDSPAKKTGQRLKALVNSEDGFQLAEKDLKIRGAGNLLGTRQSGIPDLAMDALKDASLVEKTREAAKKTLEQDPQLKNHLPLKRKVKRFQAKIHLE